MASSAWSLVSPASAQVPAVQTQGANGLVNALVVLNGQLGPNQVGLVNVGHSLNNLTALNNVLNNSPVLSNNNVLNGSPILNNNNVLQDILNNSANGNNVLNAVRLRAQRRSGDSGGVNPAADSIDEWLEWDDIMSDEVDMPYGWTLP